MTAAAQNSGGPAAFADYRFFMGEKKVAVARLDLTSKQKRMVAVVLLLLPLLIAVSGIPSG